MVGLSGNLGAGNDSFCKGVRESDGHSGNRDESDFVLERVYRIPAKNLLQNDLTILYI